VSADKHQGTGRPDFVLSDKIAKKFWQLVRMISAAAPSKRLDAFTTVAQCVAADLVHPKRFPRTEAGDRLWAVAEAMGLVLSHGEDVVQQRLSDAFDHPLTANHDRHTILHSSKDLVDGDEGSSGDDERPPEFSDEALALLFAGRHGHELKYVAIWNKFYIWKENVWRSDETLEVCDWARRLCREIASTCSNEKVARLLAGKTTVSSVVTLARADRRIAATVEQWDTDPLLLNTPSGVIDLRSGERRPHDPNDYLTKITAVAPDPSCPTPLWTAFLSRVCKNDIHLHHSAGGA
jgi:D5 N terminal like